MMQILFQLVIRRGHMGLSDRELLYWVTLKDYFYTTSSKTMLCKLEATGRNF